MAMLVNPHAGGGRAGRLLPEAEAALRALPVEVRVERTESLEHARLLAATAADAGETVVTLSGDGLIGCVAGVIHEHPAGVLGVLPGGRGNDFCRVLGIPLDDMAAACRVLAEGVERRLDLGTVDGRAFVGIASLGLDSDANRIANEAPSRLGSLVYAYAALRALAGWRAARFELELDGGERRTYVGYSVAAANAKAYGGGIYAAPGAELDDGALDVVVAESMRKVRFLTSLLPRAFKGTHVDMPEGHVMRMSRLRVDADRPFDVYADGDPIGRTPATIEVLPAAVR